MKRVFIMLMSVIAVILLVSNVFAVDLRDFPDMFTSKVKNGNVAIVVGKAAKAEDIIGSIDIAVMLQKEIGSDKKLNIAKLDNEIGDLSKYNSIVVGGPCANAAAAKLLDYPKNCLEGFEVGKGYLEFYEWENGNVALLAAGTVALDTRRTTHVLANYEDYTLSGPKMVVSGVNVNSLNIKKVE